MSYLLDFHYNFNGQGKTNTTNLNDHIRDLIYQVLFTTPGERVNRPTFGSGIMQLVFAPNSTELGAATQMLVESSLQQWLGEVIQTESVKVEVQESTLKVHIVYIVRQSQLRFEENFEFGGES